MKKPMLLVIAALILLMSSCDFVKEKNPFTKRQRERVMQMQIDSIRRADSIQKSISEARMKAVQDSLALIASAQAQEESLKYHIIVGSFITPDYAQAHHDYYVSKGYNATVLDKANSHFKLVSAGAYSSLKEASSALNGYRDTVEYESWIYIRK